MTCGVELALAILLIFSTKWRIMPIGGENRDYHNRHAERSMEGLR